MKTVEGDLLKFAQAGEFDVIAHGCNCMCAMGAGIAKGVKELFPAAYDADRATGKANKDKLGTCTFAECSIDEGTVTVVNAYIQYDYRGRGVKVDYDAVRSCMKWIAGRFPKARIGLPKIGAGLTGGDWDTIQEIIAEALGGMDVTIVEFVPG